MIDSLRNIPVPEAEWETAMELQYCEPDPDSGEIICRKVTLWKKQEPEQIPGEQPVNEPQPIIMNDLANLLIAEAAVAQLHNDELRDRLGVAVAEGFREVTKNVGNGAFLKRSF
jgi:hypothetical protein